MYSHIPQMLNAVIRAPLSFFELTPIGRCVWFHEIHGRRKLSSLTRILNLFSRDTYVAYTTHRYLAHICDSYVVDQILVRVSESTWGAG